MPDNATPRYREQTEQFVAARRAALEVAATTRTPAGETLYWIPRESQTSGPIATPPPSLPAARPGLRADELPATPELDQPGAERGPAGTVPVRLPDPARLDHSISMAERNRKVPPPPPDVTDAPPDPDYSGHSYANSQEGVTAYGCSGEYSVFVPAVVEAAHFSLIQTGLVNTQQGYMQTVEAGWQTYPDLNGEDWNPHLFTYFTTDRYSGQGDYIGGYNAFQKGWVQYDATYHPGMTFIPYSTVGGPQYSIGIKVQLWQGNWWLQAQGVWMGYYPASMFAVNGSVTDTLGDHATQVGFWGEVFDADQPKPDVAMGSGQYAAGGFGQAAYLHNLLVQSDAAGDMAAYDGGSGVTDAAWYTIDPEFTDTGSWGSYCFLGGPGAV